MSTSPESKSAESELDLDLHFLPAWAQKAPDANRYEQYKGDEGSSQRGGNFRDRRGGPGGGGGGDRGPRRDAPRPPRRDGPGAGPRGPGAGPGGPPNRDRGPQGRGDQGQRPRFGGGRPEERREPLPPLPPIEINFTPEEKGVESLARQIKLTGRAYPLFDIAFLVLKKPERYHVQFLVEKKPDGQAAQPLFVCGLDDTLWLSEQEAADYILSKHFSTFYQVEKIPTDPPKGTYTFVAQCGMSGTIFGPPNYHDYQNKLRKLHAERFSRVPFDMYKARVKIVREEATVKKWLEEQSFRNEFTCLNIPEAVKLGSREEVEKHFKETHLANLVKSVDSFTVTGVAAQAMPNRTIQNIVRRAWDDQMRFPLKIVNILSQQFARQGLQFFKVNKTVTHVAVARPHYLDVAATPVSESVKKIVEFIDKTPRCSRRKLIEAFAPGAASTEAAAPADPAAEATPPTPEMAALISDLHWLIHEGHVIEFANGTMETAKKPLPKPARPEKPKPAAAPAGGEAAPAEEAGEVTGGATPSAESEAAPATEAPATESAAPAAEPQAEAAPQAAAEQPKTEAGV